MLVHGVPSERFRWLFASHSWNGRWYLVKLRRILSALALVTAAAWSAAPPASAATDLVTSDPVARQELDTAPDGVSLSFEHVIDDGTAKILVLNSSGEHVGIGDVEYWGSTISMQLASGLPRGTYTITYRILDSAGVPEGGALQFSIGPGQWTDPLPDAEWHGESEQPPGLGNPDPYETGAPSPENTDQPEVEEIPGLATPTPTAPETSGEPTPAQTTPGETAAPQAPGTTNDWWPWAAGGVLVLATGGLGLWLATRNRSPRG